MNERITQKLAAAGVDLSVAPPPPPGADEAHAFLTERVTAAIDVVFPARFRRDYPLKPAVLAWIREFIADPPLAPSLVLTGTVGTGKSYQAWQALRRAVIGCYEHGDRRHRPSWAAVKHRKFNSLTLPCDDRQEAADNRATLARFQEVDLLLFDDLGASRVTDWGHDALLELIDVRLESSLPTIWTSNLTDAEWAARFDDRILDRLEDARTIAFVGESFRGGAR